MSKFQKSSLTVDGNSVNLSMPFAKVDKAKRTVSGYATLDNIDSQGDVVTAEASAKAFARARGNLREMHDKIAVGRIIDFREDEYYDTEDKKFYRGIFVTAYVSKGAESTWEKVLDGTLSGFSIGGEINDASNEFVKEAGRTVRFVKDYDLVELSLVDNPANQLANVFSIQKSATTGSVTVTGMVSDTVIENVFVCPVDETIVVKNTESESCPQCETKMENAGWFESGADRAEKVQSIVEKFLSPAETEAAPTVEGGVEMAKGNEETPAVARPGENPPEVPDAEKDDATLDNPEVANETVDETAGTDEEEATAEVEEVEDEETNTLEKKMDDLQAAILEAVAGVKVDTEKAVQSLEARLEEVHTSFTEKSSELQTKIEEFGPKLEAAKSRQAELESALEKMNASDAIKKSADLDDEPAETVQKSRDKSVFKPGTFSLFG